MIGFKKSLTIGLGGLAFSSSYSLANQDNEVVVKPKAQTVLGVRENLSEKVREEIRKLQADELHLV